jgi:isoprenylcysteine carboxyl methyltransferase (ICMT) family protein YpbQ
MRITSDLKFAFGMKILIVTEIVATGKLAIRSIKHFAPNYFARIFNDS